MQSLKKLDYVNVLSIVIVTVGIITEIIGGVVFSVPETVGMNTDLSPVLFAGIVLIVVGLISGIVGNVMTKKNELNNVIATIALYYSVLAVIFAIIFVACTIVFPVLFPVNG